MLYLSQFLIYAIPIIIVILFAVSIYRYVHAKRVNKKNPGTYSDDEMRKRKVFFVVFAGIFGIVALVVIGFTALLYMAVAFM